MDQKRELFDRLYPQYMVQYNLLGIQSFDDFLKRESNDHIKYGYRFRNNKDKSPKFTITSTDQRLFSDFRYLEPLLFRKVLLISTDDRTVPQIRIGVNLYILQLKKLTISGYCITDFHPSFWRDISHLKQISINCVCNIMNVEKVSFQNLELLSIGYKMENNHDEESPLQNMEPTSFISTTDFKWIQKCDTLKSLELYTVDLSYFDPVKIGDNIFNLTVMNGSLSEIPELWLMLRWLQKINLGNMCFTKFPFEQLLRFTQLTSIIFSNTTEWPNQNDFSDNPIIFDTRFKRIKELSLGNAHVRMIYFALWWLPDERDENEDDEEYEQFPHLEVLNVQNDDLDDEYTTNVWVEDNDEYINNLFVEDNGLIYNLTSITTSGMYVAPIVLEQKKLKVISTGDILMPDMTTDYDYYSISHPDADDQATEASFEMYQALYFKNTNVHSQQFSMEGYDNFESSEGHSDDEEYHAENQKKRDERDQENEEIDNESHVAYPAFRRMIKEIEEIVDKKKKLYFKYKAIIRDLTATEILESVPVPPFDCTADHQARAEFEQNSPRVFDERPMSLIRQGVEEIRPAFLKLYYMKQLLLIPNNDENNSFYTPQLINEFNEEFILNMFNTAYVNEYIEIYKSIGQKFENEWESYQTDSHFKENSQLRKKQIAQKLIHNVLSKVNDDTIREIRTGDIILKRYPFTDSQIEHAINEIDSTTFRQEFILQRKKEEVKLWIETESEKEKTKLVKKIYDFQSVIRSLDLIEGKFQTEGYDIAHSELFTTTWNNISSILIHELLLDHTFENDLNCRKQKLFPPPYVFIIPPDISQELRGQPLPPGKNINDLRRYFRGVNRDSINQFFENQEYINDTRWFFEKEMRRLFALQHRVDELWAPHIAPIQAEFNRLLPLLREQTRLENLTITEREEAEARAEQQRIEERIALQTVYEERLRALTTLAATDPAAFAELTERLAQQNAAQHEMRDLTEAEVRAAIDSINKTVFRKIPYFIPFDNTLTIPPEANLEGNTCPICLNMIDFSHQAYAISTEHVEMFNPLRTNPDKYDEVVDADGNTHNPADAVVVCNFVQSDFSGTREENAVLIANHHIHFLHYYCAAYVIQNQKKDDEIYHCIFERSKYGWGE